jgi:hypothetical protein
VARLVTSWVVMSLKVAVALNCCGFPNPIVAVAGVIAKEVTVALVIVSSALLVTPPEAAVTRAVPGEIAVAIPWVGDVLLTLARLGSKQAHCAVAVRSFVLPSEYFPMAVNACVVPAAIEALLGLIAMDCRVTLPFPPLPEVEGEDFELLPPQPATTNTSVSANTSNNLRIEFTSGNFKRRTIPPAHHFLDESCVKNAPIQQWFSMQGLFVNVLLAFVPLRPFLLIYF